MLSLTIRSPNTIILRKHYIIIDNTRALWRNIISTRERLNLNHITLAATVRPLFVFDYCVFAHVEYGNHTRNNDWIYSFQRMGAYCHLISLCGFFFLSRKYFIRSEAFIIRYTCVYTRTRIQECVRVLSRLQNKIRGEPILPCVQVRERSLVLIILIKYCHKTINENFNKMKNRIRTLFPPYVL